MKITKVSLVSPVYLSRPDPTLTLWDIWERWKNSVPAGAGEERDIAVRRMEACIENESQPLDLRELELSSLPPYLPPNSKLTVSENLLEALLQYTQLERTTDKFIADYVDNFFLYHFDNCFLNELNEDNSDFVYTLFSEEADNKAAVIERVNQAFNARRDTILPGVREGLIAYIHYIVNAGLLSDFSSVKAELEILLHGEFCKTAYHCAIKLLDA